MALSPNLGTVTEYRGVEGLVAAEVLTDDNEVSGGYTTDDVFSIAGVAEIIPEITLILIVGIGLAVLGQIQISNFIIDLLRNHLLSLLHGGNRGCADAPCGGKTAESHCASGGSGNLQCGGAGETLSETVSGGRSGIRSADEVAKARRRSV